MRPFLLLGSAVALGAMTSAPLPVAAAAANPPVALNLDKVAGVYKHRFSDSFMDGQTYVAEDVLEIVKVSPTAAYFRTHLDFANGHICELFGVADMQDDALVYRDPAAPAQGEAPCVLKLKVSAGVLTFDDGEGTCKTYCGARGSFGGEAFPRRERRPIRYMTRLMNSSEYKDAIRARTDEPGAAKR